MGIAASTGLTAGIVICAGIGVIGLVERTRSRPEPPIPLFEVTTPVDLTPEPSSSSVQHEPPVVQPPFYASLFVAGATWTLPCTFGFDAEPSELQRCHVDSVEVTAGETRARIACWFVHDPDLWDPHPAINTYVMTAKGLYINDASGEPLFTPNPVPQPLPEHWGGEQPSSPDGDTASAMVRHHGAWCRIHEFQGWDTGGGTTECISRRGIVGSSYHRDRTMQRCGDVP